MEALTARTDLSAAADDHHDDHRTSSAADRDRDRHRPPRGARRGFGFKPPAARGAHHGRPGPAIRLPEAGDGASGSQVDGRATMNGDAAAGHVVNGVGDSHAPPRGAAAAARKDPQRQPATSTNKQTSALRRPAPRANASSRAGPNQQRGGRSTTSDGAAQLVNGGGQGGTSVAARQRLAVPPDKSVRMFVSYRSTQDDPHSPLQSAVCSPRVGPSSSRADPAAAMLQVPAGGGTRDARQTAPPCQSRWSFFFFFSGMHH